MVQALSVYSRPDSAVDRWWQIGSPCSGVASTLLSWAFVVERVTRIELALSAWEADVLPLNYTRNAVGRLPGSRCHPQT